MPPNILGLERGDQRTMCSNDFDMLNHLLTERDEQLKLAGRIGHALLNARHILREKIESLEENLAQALDQVNQLRHELNTRNALLRAVSTDAEDSESFETDSSCSTPLRPNDSFILTHGLLHLDNLHGRRQELEEENSQESQDSKDTVTCEEDAQQLVIHCIEDETNLQISQLILELSSKSEEIEQYKEQISTSHSQFDDLQHKLREKEKEKEELENHLQASKEARRQLSVELHELQDRHAECQAMLKECQDQLKTIKCKDSPSAPLRRRQTCSVFPMDSLAAEIEGTMRRELNFDEESNFEKRKIQPKRIFGTVKVANELRKRSSSVPAPSPIPGSNQSDVAMTALPFQSVVKEEQKDDLTEKLEAGRKSEVSEDLNLETEIRRLNYWSENQFFQNAYERKSEVLEDERDFAGCNFPSGSVHSMETQSNCTDFSLSPSHCSTLEWKWKLQIVKPLEGSQTLHQWQQLAQPNLGAILDPRPGVIPKDFKPLPEDAEYYLCDLEEDDNEEDDDGGITFQVREREDDVPNSSLNIFLPPVSGTLTSDTNPAKSLCNTFSTFTFTNSQTLRPSDITQVTSSSSTLTRARVCSTPMSYQPTTRESSSVHNLAKLLHEKGISAKADLDEECTQLHHSNTLTHPSTPPNSPSISPCSSLLRVEPQASPLENLLAVSRPVESFLPSSATQQKINLLQRLTRMLIERLDDTTGSNSHQVRSTLNDRIKRQEPAVFPYPSNRMLGGFRRNQSLPALMGGLSPHSFTYSPYNR
uniref:Trafficking kinesin-binding protein 1 n=1 Tax=Leptobrachium leishanense TaxID=445787 RepID=A0A8C5PZ62_9ANUR